MERTVVVLLRVGFAMCFIGHGAFGVLQKREWLVFFDRFGIGESAALTLMPLVGAVDILVGMLALVLPLRAAFAYGAFWALFTAALRPMAGLSVAEFLERRATTACHWHCWRLPLDQGGGTGFRAKFPLPECARCLC